jgi:hypothetical protein
LLYSVIVSSVTLAYFDEAYLAARMAQCFRDLGEAGHAAATPAGSQTPTGGLPGGVARVMRCLLARQSRSGPHLAAPLLAQVNASTRGCAMG